MSDTVQVPMRIIKIERKKNRVTVYNFSVENDESYVLNGIASHNCRCGLAPVSGDVTGFDTPEFTKGFDEWLNGD